MEIFIVIISAIAFLEMINSVIKSIIQFQELDINMASTIIFILSLFALSFNVVAWILIVIYILFLLIKIINY